MNTKRQIGTKIVLLTLFLVVAILNCNAGKKSSSNKNFGFIERSTDQLMENGKEFRFIGMNTPNIHIQEDKSFLSENWHRVNEYEIRDIFETIRQMGGTVTRTYVFSVVGGSNNPTQKSHINALRLYDEDLFRDFDLVLKLANEYEIRLIVPFVDNWDWWGGTKQLAAFRGKEKGEFCSDSLVKEDYKDLIKFVLNRRNTLTGVLYKNDPAILAWETGNELGIENAHGSALELDKWTLEMAAYIKSIDKNHLVNDGKDCYRYGLSDEQVNNPYIDMITDHYYWGDFISSCAKSREKCKGKKVFYVGEFNHENIDIHDKLFKEVISDGTSGALVWSLRFHTNDGGFYFHSEKADASNPCYRWPGFSSSNTNEFNKMQQIRNFAYQIRGIKEPALPKPMAPYLIPESTPAQLRWRGSTGATSYIIERKTQKDSHWVILDAKALEDAIPYIPYMDKSAEKGIKYYYRLKAENKSGISEFSNIIGPILF
ncbi:MAG TPA: hypothetical protein VIK20_00930 [Bacteroidales bacterium]